MANEVVMDIDAQVAADLERMVIEEARPATAFLPLVKVRDVIGQPTLTKKFTVAPSGIVAAAVAEGVDLANTAAQPSAKTITAAEVGLMFAPTDLGNKHSTWNINELTKLMVRGFVQKWDADIAALFAGFSSVVGATGVDLSLANYLSAIFTLELANATGVYAAGLHTIQVHDLRTALIAAGGAIFGSTNVDKIGSLLNASGNKALKGELFSVPVYGSTTVPTANAGADRAGGMFCTGEDSAIGWLWADPLSIETQRDASLRATEVVGVSVYGLAELEDHKGVAIVTDA
jgi:hypothetical protein